MKAEIHYSHIPYKYMMCLNQECPQADTCLRQLAVQSVPAHVESWTITSPKYLASLTGDCPHYRSSVKVYFAQGFIQLLENLPHKQMQVVIARLTDHFGRRTYYRVRKGERLLSPSEQKEVQNILKECGVSHPQDFDAYIELYDW